MSSFPGNCSSWGCFVWAPVEAVRLAVVGLMVGWWTDAAFEAIECHLRGSWLRNGRSFRVPLRLLIHLWQVYLDDIAASMLKLDVFSSLNRFPQIFQSRAARFEKIISKSFRAHPLPPTTTFPAHIRSYYSIFSSSTWPLTLVLPAPPVDVSSSVSWDCHILSRHIPHRDFCCHSQASR